MTNLADPFAPPSSRDALDDRPRTALGGEFVYHSPLRVLLLALATFNVYLVVWLYQQFAAQKRAHNGNTTPILRAIFSPFFVHELFSSVRLSLQQADLTPKGSSSGGATLFVIMLIAGNLLGRASPLLGFVSLIAAIPIYQCQQDINALLDHQAPDRRRPSEFGVGTILVLLLGGLFILAAIVGSLQSVKGS